jgi:hypothetical protein
MPSPCILTEFRETWLPHVTDCGLERLIDLLEKGSPFLIHGSFTRAVPLGCLASHIAWNHPETEHLDHEAGVMWLTRIAGLNPATSQVIRAWDELGIHDFELRSDLLVACREEHERRSSCEVEPLVTAVG